MESSVVKDLVALSRELGREDRGLAILAEGNTSARADEETIWVKASGASLATLRAEDLVQCRLPALLTLLDQHGLSDEQIDEALSASRLDPDGRRPSLEAVFHAFLLSLPGVKFAGHSHAPCVISMMCSPRARDFAERRMFPDEAGCCGVAWVFVPYIEPGLKLAQAIRAQTNAFIQKQKYQPRVILLQNHGVITLGPTWQAVLAAMLMAEKAARVFIGAAALGGPVFLSEAEAHRFADRPDEVYRRRVLNKE